MKTISLWQPWASLVAAGIKKIETRSWMPGLGMLGPLAIHAAKRPMDDVGQDLLRRLRTLAVPDLELFDVPELPFGAVVCVVELFQVVPVERAPRNSVERLCGDFSPGRWAWVLREPRKLARPYPCRGHQRFFTVEIPWTFAPVVIPSTPFEGVRSFDLAEKRQGTGALQDAIARD